MTRESAWCLTSPANTHAHTHAHTHTRTQHSYTCTYTYAHAHAYTTPTYTTHLSASSRITILCRPGGRVTFFWANIFILLRTTSIPLRKWHHSKHRQVPHVWGGSTLVGCMKTSNLIVKVAVHHNEHPQFSNILSWPLHMVFHSDSEFYLPLPLDQ
jgi:hypothetical protein